MIKIGTSGFFFPDWVGAIYSANVGNPFSLGPINPGEAILGVGCGAGFGLIVASRFIGKTGRVCGIDLTPEMVESARMNLR
ncbi:MAG: methyltransferase domain-containing protein [Candidatus Brocadia sp.]|nr:methyltransferase domain-containing protein [Candidatus Brocadia sp.]